MVRTFRFRLSGRAHREGDRNCTGCEPLAGKRYPREHRDDGVACSGLIHAEKLKDATGGHLIICLCDHCGHAI